MFLTRERKVLIALLLTASAVLILGMFCAARMLRPAQPGTPEAFWDALYHLNLSERGYFRGVYPMQGDVCIYSVQGFHGQFIYTVPLEDARRLLPRIRERAPKEFDGLTDRERELLSSGADVAALVQARIDAHLSSDDEESRLDAARFESDLDAFKEKWRRIQRYSLNIALELLYLHAWLLMLWTPVFHGKSRIACSMALTFALPLLLMPYYLGYVPWTFTSAGPGGGALYPMLIIFFGKPSWGWTVLDRGLVEVLGQPLEPLNQLPGPMWSVSGMGAPAPSFTLAVGLVLGAAFFILHKTIERRKPAATTT